MQGDEARVLLGFPPNSRPTLSQGLNTSLSMVKAAYRKKVWESHPDLFPLHEKPGAESKFKLVIKHSQTFLFVISFSFSVFQEFCVFSTYGWLLRFQKLTLICRLVYLEDPFYGFDFEEETQVN
ncbi:uncharacterized protein [Populus alba]|uniref:uncharacterized protein isoform X2 n=1 Tax=Populus alba TaxID=43335 RepID=UPI003CC74957